jgi:5-(carboxyamino)imidazole ribonucleotide synthase
MWNILGDLWNNGTPDWNAVLIDPRAKLHLYGKSKARPGRKMGHVCLTAETTEEALLGIKKLQAAMSRTA